MSTGDIIQQLEDERDRITTAINALRSNSNSGGPRLITRRGKRVLSDAAKRRISDAMRKKWAERKARA